MEGQNLKKKTLVCSFVQFLNRETKSLHLSMNRKESIAVAVNCLEEAFEITSEDRDVLNKVDLLSQIPLSNQDISDGEVIVAEHYKNLGNEAMIKYKYDEAIAQYTRALNVYPGNPVYYCNRATAYSLCGGLFNEQEAVRNCEQAIALCPTYARAFERLGFAYGNLARWTDAVRAFENAVLNDPRNTCYHELLCLARERLLQGMECAYPSHHRPVDISKFVNSDQHIPVAREVMADSNIKITKGMMLDRRGASTDLSITNIPETPELEREDGPSSQLD